MTEKIYLDDSYRAEMEAAVIACEEESGGYAVELDRTVFFPAGGGQPCDAGELGGFEVTGVREQKGRVLHAVRSPLRPGTTIHGRIDWARRFDHMQQHSGEHLLSFAAMELYGAVNVGFHMAAEHCTLDLDTPLTREQIEAMEARANALVYANLPVRARYVETDELEALPLRKRAEGIEGRVRVVAIPGADACTCCGTHVARTGEIGTILVTAAERHKGGARLTFACGTRALAFAQSTRAIVDETARAHSCKPQEVPKAGEARQRELASVKRERDALCARLNRAVARELRREVRAVGEWRLMAGLVDVPASQLRPLALSLCGEAHVLAFLLCREAGGLHYALCRSEGSALDMGDLAQAVNLALQGKGGGRGSLAQGRAGDAPGQEEAVGQLIAYMQQRLRALSGK